MENTSCGTKRGGGETKVSNGERETLDANRPEHPPNPPNEGTLTQHAVPSSTSSLSSAAMEVGNSGPVYAISPAACGLVPEDDQGHGFSSVPYFSSAPRPKANAEKMAASYAINWNNYANVLQNLFRKVNLSHQFADVGLACQGETIKCHRLLLAACSSYFEKVLTENEGNNVVIYVTGMRAQDLHALVKFMYTGHIEVEESQLQNFIDAAKKLNISGLGLETPAVGGMNGGASKYGVEMPTHGSQSMYNDNPPAVVGLEPPKLAVYDMAAKKSPNKLPATPAQPVEVQLAFGNYRNFLNQAQTQDSLKPKPTSSSSSSQINAAVSSELLSIVNMQNRKAGANLRRMNPPGNVRNLVKSKTTFGKEYRGVSIKSVQNTGSKSKPTILGQVVGYETEDYISESDELYGKASYTYDQTKGGLQGVASGMNASGNCSITGMGKANANVNGRISDMGKGKANANGSRVLEDEEIEELLDLDSDNDGELEVMRSSSGQEVDFSNSNESVVEKVHETKVMTETKKTLKETPSTKRRVYTPEHYRTLKAAFDAMQEGVSIRQCSAVFGIHQKKLAAWKVRGFPEPNSMPSGHFKRTSQTTFNSSSTATQRKGNRTLRNIYTGPPEERQKALDSACDMAQTGVPVLLAAAEFGVPRTTLVNHMKRKGLSSVFRQEKNWNGPGSGSNSCSPTHGPADEEEYRIGATTITLNRNNMPPGANRYRIFAGDNGSTGVGIPLERQDVPPNNFQMDMDSTGSKSMGSADNEGADEVQFLGLVQHMDQNRTLWAQAATSGGGK